MSHCIVSLAQRPELQGEVERLHERAWPRFIIEGHSPDESMQMWDPLMATFAEYQLVMLDGEGRPMACGHTIPLVWDGTVEGLPHGWAGAMLGGFGDHKTGRKPTAVSALSMAVAPECRGQGIAAVLLRAMKDLAVNRGLAAMIAPVRPSLKDRYPLTPIDRYVQWRRGDGLPFDPWIRVHAKLGARELGVAYGSMTITGNVAEWKTWTGLAFPESGPYIVPGALVPVMIDCHQDEGRYEEPNFWMMHPVDQDSGNATIDSSPRRQVIEATGRQRINRRGGRAD